MAPRKTKEILPTRKRKEAATKQNPPTPKSKETVSDSDGSEVEPAPPPTKKNKSSQEKSQSSSEPVTLAHALGSGNQEDTQQQKSPPTSKIETESDEKEDGSTEEEGNSSKSDGQDAASSSTSASPAQEHGGAAQDKKAVATATNKSTNEVASVNGVKGKADIELGKKHSQDQEEEEDDDDEEDEEGNEEDESENGEEGDESGSTSAGSEDSPAAISTDKASYEVVPVSGVKRKAETELERPDDQDQEEEEDDDDEEDEKEEEDEEEQEDGEEEEEEEDESESGGEGDDSGGTSAGSEDLPTHVAKEKAPAPLSRAQRSLKAYKPPAGFGTSSISFAPSSEVSRLLQASSLEGKQIWHITVPQQLPVKLLADISEKSLQDGSSVLSHEDNEYGLLRDSRPKDAVLLLPSAEKNQYRSSQAPVSAIYHVGQIVKLPVPEIVPNATAASLTESSTPRHQQPAGLKMRYHPFGVSSDSDSDEDAPKSRRPFILAPPPVFRAPPAAEKSSTPKKRKSKSGTAESLREPSSATKARKLPTSLPISQINVSDEMDIDLPEINSRPVEKSITLEKKKRKAATIEGSTSKPSPVGSEKLDPTPASTFQINESDKMDVDQPQRKQSSPDKTKKSRKPKQPELALKEPQVNGFDTSSQNKQSSTGEVKKPKRSKKSETLHSQPQINGSNNISDIKQQQLSSDRSKKPQELESQLRTTSKMTGPDSTNPDPSTSKAIESDRTKKPKHDESTKTTKSITEPSPSNSTKLNTIPPEVVPKTPEKAKKKKSKPISTAQPTTESTNYIKTTDANAMNIDSSSPSLSSLHPPIEPFQENPSLAPNTSTSKYTPEERIKRKEEKRQRKALKKQQEEEQSSTSTPLPNGSSPLSKTPKSGAPALPLSEYSAILSSAEKGKPTPSSQPTVGSIKTILSRQSLSQSAIGEQSSPLGKEKKKKKVRWRDGEGS